jgi:hypothetical protein
MMLIHLLLTKIEKLDAYANYSVSGLWMHLQIKYFLKHVHLQTIQFLLC